MARAPEALVLTTDELAFMRWTCDLFPTPESPLCFLDQDDLEPEDAAEVFAALERRGLLDDAGAGAAQHVRDRVQPVSECNARVSLASRDPDVSRDFYVNADGGVEYRRESDAHRFGPVRSEPALAAELAQHFAAAVKESPRSLRMSAGDYLVFAVFARDVRAAPEPPTDGEAPMSLDEVLAYFDEPETRIVRTPSDESWQASLAALGEQGVLLAGEDGYRLDPIWHPLAREIVADRQHTVTRFDFLDEHWLVREVSLYPTGESVYRLGTESDGSVLIEELSAATLADTVAGVVGTLPNLLSADTTLTSPVLVGQTPKA